MSRRLLFLCTIGAGVCALSGLLVTTYAIIRTPGLHDIPVYNEQGVLRSTNKLLYLCWPVFAQFVLFGVALFHSIKWEVFTHKFLRSVADYNARHSSAGRLDVEQLYKIICYAIFGFEFVILALVLNNAIGLLNLQLVE